DCWCRSLDWCNKKARDGNTRTLCALEVVLASGRRIEVRRDFDCKTSGIWVSVPVPAIAACFEGFPQVERRILGPNAPANVIKHFPSECVIAVGEVKAD